MLYNIYTAIKAQIDAVDTANTIKGIEWYNVQYDGSIPTTPRVFIEFPERLGFEGISKDARRTDMPVRLHIVTQAMAASDGTVADAVALAHETTALLVMGAIDGFTPTSAGTKLTTRLIFNGWQHFHKHKGWMVTFVEFSAKKLL